VALGVAAGSGGGGPSGPVARARGGVQAGPAAAEGANGRGSAAGRGAVERGEAPAAPGVDVAAGGVEEGSDRRDEVGGGGVVVAARGGGGGRAGLGLGAGRGAVVGRIEGNAAVGAPAAGRGGDVVVVGVGATSRAAGPSRPAIPPVVPAGRRPVQRRASRRVPRRRICPRRPGAPRRLSQGVDGPSAQLRPQEEPHDGAVAIARGAVQRRRSSLVPRVNGDATLEEEAGGGEAALLGGAMEGGGSVDGGWLGKGPAGGEAGVGLGVGVGGEGRDVTDRRPVVRTGQIPARGRG